MKIFHALLPALICATLIISGCTTAPASSGTAVPSVPAAHAPEVTLSSLVLVRADLPDGYVMTMNREKNTSEVGSIARDLGWQAGYVAEFTATSDVPASLRNVVRQSLATYPEGSLPAIVESVNRSDQSSPDLPYHEFPVTGLGGDARGFTAGSGNSIRITSPSAAAGPLPGLADVGGGTATSTPGQSIAEVIFSKGSTLEVIRITGPAPGPDDVLAIARKAYSKIP